ncbi:hypothetical protein JTE90_014851 [Oedothorax gibbosus]|uniref:Uncharacterized protein n=1 Tax=Oedothorax gibbosus TaxID=931172 RepID=A0AAV6U0H3_9ARAC|nr:hypothetical protein JTE90_014851 [Oedothorax gibbosus]
MNSICKKKLRARIEKENDKNRTDGTVTAVYDLQAILQIPKGQISLFFYKSRINCLNLTVSDLRAKDVVCYFGDETEELLKLAAAYSITLNGR